MKKISSFTVDHLKLLSGIYVSRVDNIKDVVLTTFDLRFTRPNFEPVMDTSAIHTIEHLGATFLRNDMEFKDDIIYFGPMGCRSGFYLILNGKRESKDIVSLISRMIDYIIDFYGDIPGATAAECGNYTDMNLSMAKYYAAKFKNEVLDDLTDEKLVYPK